MADDTSNQISEGCNALITSGCAKRQAVEASKARAETLVDLDVALAILGEELPKRKCGGGEW